METRILETLKEIEQKHDVKILYACETGSRAWGFASPDSDYDVRMIYKHTEAWYLTLHEKKDTIEFMSSDKELDITGWDIKKCLQLMYKSNGALLERVQSPIVYHQEQDVASFLKRYSEHCFSPIATLYHYLGMAKTSFSEVNEKSESKLKKLFYALRAALACKWILEKGTVPPIVFITMVNELSFDTALKTRINELVILKSTKMETYLHASEMDLCKFIQEELTKAELAFKTLTGRKEKVVDLDAVFYKLIKEY